MARVFAFGSLNLLNWNLYLSQGADAFVDLDLETDIALRADVVGDYTVTAPTYNDVIEQPIPFGADTVTWFIAGQNIEYIPDVSLTGTVEGFYEYYNDALSWFIEGLSISIVDLAEASRTPSLTDDQALIAQMFAGDDEFYLSPDADLVQAHAGNDFVYGDAGDDVLFGNADDDEVNGGIGADDVYGGTGNDILLGGFGSDAVYGGAGDDFLFGSLFYDDAQLEDPVFRALIEGEAFVSTDFLLGGLGNDFYLIDDVANAPFIFEEAGEGTDTVMSGLSVYFIPQNVEYYVNDGVNTTDGTNDLGTEVFGNDLDNLIKTSALSFDSVADIIGTINPDFVSAETFHGDAGNDTLRSGAGDDLLYGGTGADSLDGGSGADTMIGGVGNDTFVTDGTDTITENAGEGTDVVQSSATHTLGANIENLVLTGGAAIDGTGNALANAITGNAAANSLSGGAGADTINGGLGSDTLSGGTGDDTFITDGGDTINEVAGEGTDTVQSSATFTLGATLENLLLTGTSAINGTGNGSANGITGNSAANTLTGNGGNDTLSGAAGNDLLAGGAGRDVLTGGAGNDQFVFRAATESAASATGADVIADFVRGSDKISLSAIDAFAGGGTVNDTFLWRGTAAFTSATAGEVRYQQFDTYTMVFIDTDADVSVEMAIRVNGLHSFTASDFLL